MGIKKHIDLSKAQGVRVALINQSNEMLVLYNKKLKTYTFPGGAVEKGETVDAAARRELKEEVGIDVDILKLGFVVDLEVYNEGVYNETLSGLTAIMYTSWEGEIRNCEPDKHSDLHWFGGDHELLDLAIREAYIELRKNKEIHKPRFYKVKI